LNWLDKKFPFSGPGKLIYQQCSIGDIEQEEISVEKKITNPLNIGREKKTR
jgi:hypothetical protein